jgi:hypothetical protein
LRATIYDDDKFFFKLKIFIWLITNGGYKTKESGGLGLNAMLKDLMILIAFRNK